jgi:hypothetical protein
LASLGLALLASLGLASLGLGTLLWMGALLLGLPGALRSGGLLARLLALPGALRPMGLLARLLLKNGHGSHETGPPTRPFFVCERSGGRTLPESQRSVPLSSRAQIADAMFL